MGKVPVHSKSSTVARSSELKKHLTVAQNQESVLTQNRFVTSGFMVDTILIRVFKTLTEQIIFRVTSGRIQETSLVLASLKGDASFRSQNVFLSVCLRGSVLLSV